MLGDGHAERPTPRNNTRIPFHHSDVQKLYIDHLWSLIGPFCGTAPKMFINTDSRPNRNWSCSWKFSTFSLPCLISIGNYFMIAMGLNLYPKIWGIY